MNKILCLACCLATWALVALPFGARASVLTAEAAPLLTTSGNPGGYTVAPGGAYDGVVNIYVQTSSGGNYGSGVLLSTGKHILTAAHMITDGNGALNASVSLVSFDVPAGALLMVGTTFTAHPDWDGDVFRGNDIAVIELSSVAPAYIPRYQIYEGTNEVGQVGVKVGYGLSGEGRIQEALYPFGTKRSGKNKYDASADLMLTALGLNAGTDFVPGSVLQYDFDNGLPANDAFGYFFGLHDLGLGPLEVSAASGDSGGPTFIDGKIAGITSYGVTLYYEDSGDTSDVNSMFDASYGEFGGDTRVAYYADWLREVVPGLPSAVIPEPASIVVWSLLGGLAIAAGLRRGRPQ